MSPPYQPVQVGSFTPPPQTPLSPAAEQELARLAQGLGNVRTRGALVLARAAVSSVLAACEELRCLRRAQLRQERQAAKSSQSALDLSRIDEMLDEEAGVDQAAAPEDSTPVVDEAQRERDAKAVARALEILDALGKEVHGASVQAQLSISGVGKEVAWLMNHAKDPAVKAAGGGLVARWRQDCRSAVKAPITVAALATELEAALFEQGGGDDTHKKYYARVRELAANLRYAAPVRYGLLCREVLPADVARWEKEAFWSPERKAKAAASAEEAARKVIAASGASGQDQFDDPRLQCPDCGKAGAVCTVLSEYADDGIRRLRAECNHCRHRWQSEQ